jgi:hypothetical protein
MHRSAILSISAAIIVVLCLLAFQKSRQWLKRRFATFDWLPEYFTSAARTMQDILWGALLPFVAWGIWFIVSNPPTWVNATAIGTALFLAGYYVWRADHIRLIPGFKIDSYALQESDTIDGLEKKTGWSVFFQLQPKCLTEAHVDDCRGLITSIEMWDGFNNGWNTVESEVMYLGWSHRGHEPIMLYSGAESRLNVFYVPSDTKEMRPCVHPYPVRFVTLFNQLGLRQIRAVRFNIRVIGKDCSPVDLAMTVQMGNDPFRPHIDLEPVAKR